MTREHADAIAKKLYGSRGYAADMTDIKGATFRYVVGYTRKGRTRTLKTVKASSSISFDHALDSILRGRSCPKCSSESYYWLSSSGRCADCGFHWGLKT